MWVILVIAVLIFVFLVYSVLLLWITAAVSRHSANAVTIPPISSASPPNLKISVVIPVRNESGSIIGCLDSLLKQTFPGEWEVVLSDDFSTDNTMPLAEKFYLLNLSFPIRFIRPEAGQPTGKKAAVTRGVRAASGQLILVTDADTVRDVNWLSSMGACFSAEKVKMVVAPVILQPNNSLLGRIQYTEFLGVIGITWGAIAGKRPVMCNGANLAYRRDTFMEIGGYTGNSNIASGDDYFLMQRVISVYGSDSVIFNPLKAAIVKTPVQQNLSDFLEQRKRWGSKGPSYRDPFVIILSLATLLVPVSVLIALIAGMFEPVFFLIVTGIMVAKMTVDFRIVRITAVQLDCGFRFRDFLAGEIFQIIYIPVAGFMSLVLPYKWKGRIIRKPDSGSL